MDNLRNHKFPIFFAKLRDLGFISGYAPPPPVYGARPIKRFIQQAVETPLARYLIGGEATGDSITVDYSDKEGLVIK